MIARGGRSQRRQRIGRTARPVERLVEDGTAAVLALPGRYSVTYLLLAERAVAVVDVGSTADIPAILAALDRLGRRPGDVRFVLPTHLHFDHLMGIDALALRLGASVALGAAAAAQIKRARRLRWPPTYQVLRAVPTWAWQGAPLPPLSDLRGGLDFGFPWSRQRFSASIGPVLADGDELDGFSGWRVLATPGHTDDAICLYHADAGYLIAGDVVRNFLGGEWNPVCVDPAGYARTRSLLESLRIKVVFPGHGPILEGFSIRTLPAYVP